jgi:molybdenum cofactor cytidylyltransferase
MILGLLPAAGRSARMGRPKLALPLGGRSVLEHVVAALLRGGVEHVLVVAAPHTAELAALAEAAGAACLLLQQPTPDMRATVEHGLAWLEERFRPGPGDAWALAPADHPTLDAAVVRRLLAARASEPGRSVVVPTFEGRRGHPTLIGWRHVAGLRAHPSGEGVNAYLRLHREQTREVPVDSPAVLCDLDTPEDYERLLRLFTGPNPGA